MKYLHFILIIIFIDILFTSCNYKSKENSNNNKRIDPKVKYVIETPDKHFNVPLTEDSHEKLINWFSTKGISFPKRFYDGSIWEEQTKRAFLPVDIDESLHSYINNINNRVALTPKDADFCTGTSIALDLENNKIIGDSKFFKYIKK
ncbi:hypothetical protein HY745_10515 [Candidatus Desantisbacteria bacterium]|nr:hypothetical protein [Candidatus Desantisbacteria bacterium]